MPHSTLMCRSFKLFKLRRNRELLKAAPEIFNVTPLEAWRDPAADLRQRPRTRDQGDAVVSHSLDKCA
jgi:hypothetical protein